MGFLGRFLGTERPRIPKGGRAFVSDDMPGWSVRYAMPGEDMTPACKKVGPTFDYQMNAERYLDWINGGPRFEYPDGAA